MHNELIFTLRLYYFIKCFFATEQGAYLFQKPGKRSGLKLFLKRQRAALKNNPNNESATGAKEKADTLEATEETAKPIKNVFVPFLIILEEK